VDVREDDYASMIATVESWMPREKIAEALGVEERELDDIASGGVPGEDVAVRLRALAASDGKRGTFVFTSGRRLTLTGVITFLVMDLIVVAAIAFFVLSR